MRWRRASAENQYVSNAAPAYGGDFDDEDGEELSDVDERRREALSLDSRRDVLDDRRLSRDLEEGFRDDSDDETAVDTRQSRSTTQ